MDRLAVRAGDELPGAAGGRGTRADALRAGAARSGHDGSRRARGGDQRGRDQRHGDRRPSTRGARRPDRRRPPQRADPTHRRARARPVPRDHAPRRVRGPRSRPVRRSEAHPRGTGVRGHHGRVPRRERGGLRAHDGAQPRPPRRCAPPAGPRVRQVGGRDDHPCRGSSDLPRRLRHRLADDAGDVPTGATGPSTRQHAGAPAIPPGGSSWATSTPPRGRPRSAGSSTTATSRTRSRASGSRSPGPSPIRCCGSRSTTRCSVRRSRPPPGAPDRRSARSTGACT